MAEDRAQDLAALVVIGASAGGLDALTELLGPIPKSFPAAIVVAQHTLPTRASHLAEILSSRTQLSIRMVEERQGLIPGTVYLVPSDNHVLITDHAVEARQARGDRPSPSIDRLLTSAAEQFSDRLIAVILSGMGSDGVLGAAEVKANGGTVVIQNPETAAQPAMPRALPPNIVDFVANADQMGDLLTELVTAPLKPQPENEERLLEQFLDRVRERTGIDFTAYKRPTVMRRLHRRMMATGSSRLRDYIRFVQKHPEEYQRLSSAFLIKVTQFFRDADLFDHLRTAVLPALIQAGRGHGRELRIWSAGCATGEEAYSLAILIAEGLGEELERFTVRVFATDLDSEAINYARRGDYPAATLTNVPEELLERWFIRDGEKFEVVKEIRSMVVFGEHDLAQRAPFPRIDLVLCRNVLIYFTPELQKRALQLFAFSLRDGGYLVLGKAESTTPFSEQFVLDQPRLKVYRRAGERVPLPPAGVRDGAPTIRARREPRRGPTWATTQGQRTRREDDRPAPAGTDELLLRLPVGVIVIDANYDISFLNAMARRLLSIHGPAVGQDFIHLAHPLPSEELRAAIASTMGGETLVVTRPLPVQSDEERDMTHVQLTLQPQRDEGADGVGAVVITATDVSQAVRDRVALDLELARSREDRGTLAQRTERLTRTNRELLQANEEMTNANVTLRGSNEDLLVANEEVQAATEEVETLNEELQATNEELETLNEELQATVEELNTTNDDLEARGAQLTEAAASLAEQRQLSEIERERLSLILEGMNEAVLVVDHDGRIQSSNRAYEEAFGGAGTLIPEDGTGIKLPPEEWPQARVARGEHFSMSFTHEDGRTGERRWYEANGRGVNGALDGIIVIRDITDRSLRHLQERFIDTASHELKTPLAAMHNYLQLVARGAGKSLDEATQAYLERAIEQSRELGELASRLFDISLIRHGRLVVEHEPLDIRDVVKEAAGQLRIVSGNVPIRQELGRRRIVVLGDRLRLHQMLGNLLTNALTHGASPSGVSITVDAEEGEARIKVSDRGPGIPRAVQAQLFTPFISTASNGVEGLGLGLFLARAIARDHGGTLFVEARGGRGTEVVVTLPLAKAAARTQAAAPAARSRSNAPGRPRKSRGAVGDVA